jgi:nicotinamidase-related amidase
MSKRALLAINMQPYFHAPAALAERISDLGKRFPMAATLFVHDEARVPYQHLRGHAGPTSDACLVTTDYIFRQYGYSLPDELLQHFKNLEITEVVIVGAQTDECLLAAGISLFDAGFEPSMIPELCYQNNWFEHTVTVRLFESSIGKVYESAMELM